MEITILIIIIHIICIYNLFSKIPEEKISFLHWILIIISTTILSTETLMNRHKELEELKSSEKGEYVHIGENIYKKIY